MQQMYGNYGFGNPGYGMAGPYMERFHQQMAAQQQRPMELVRVTGMDGAKAFQMPPNSTAALFDDSQDIFFVKSTDGAGFPTIRTFSFAPYEPAGASCRWCGSSTNSKSLFPARIPNKSFRACSPPAR